MMVRNWKQKGRKALDRQSCACHFTICDSRLAVLAGGRSAFAVPKP